MATTNTAIEYDIVGNIDDIVNKLGRVEDALGNLDKKNKDIEKSASKIGGSFESFIGNLSANAVSALTNTLAGLGQEVVNLTKKVVENAGSFEAQINSIKAVSGLSNEATKEIENLALKLGSETKYSALEAAVGIEELVKAGVSMEEILSGGAKSALTLASAGVLDVKDAAEIASIALNTFKKDNLTVAQAADILAGGANASATDVMELKFGLAQAGVVANSLGLTFKDTATALSVFAQNGLKGSDAGTSLKTMLGNLQPTTKAQMNLMEELGLVTVAWEKGARGAKKEGVVLTNAFFDQNGKIKDLASIADILQDKMGKMTEQQKNLALETLFGSDAIRAGTILANEGAEGFSKMAGEMAKVTAEQVAQTRQEGFVGTWERFNNTLETIGIKLGQTILPFLTVGINYIDNLLNGQAEDNALTRIINFIGQKAGEVGTTLLPELKKQFTEIFDTVKNFLNENEGRIKSMIQDTFNIIKENGPAIIDMIGEIAKAAIKIADAFLKADEQFKNFTKSTGGLAGNVGAVATGNSALIGNEIAKKILGKNAMGTSNFGGGFTMVGENGPELLNLPKNSAIKPASASQNISNNTNNQTVINNFRFSKLSDLKNQLAFI